MILEHGEAPGFGLSSPRDSLESEASHVEYVTDQVRSAASGAIINDNDLADRYGLPVD